MFHIIRDAFFNVIAMPLRVLFGKNKYVKPLFAKELKKGDSVYLKTPSIIPQGILNDLSVLFEKYPAILLAYLSEGFLEPDEPPHYIIGIKIDPKFNLRIEQLMELMAKELNEVIPRGFYVDIIAICDTDAPIYNFMQNYLIPFYARAKNNSG
ncbi:MAG: enhanced serine sensitivity protein SseB C-terminal domain-containing protein [Candidatus Omnitrophota bacterium]|nr:enhanced serine sensitivity protein SseB C-terminal domain-containing protein [Candidatus Omnitrophota bacterium]